tara:strand:+ start:1137 stop:1367 length:231 start_codon:yes stop_codon:yes gene_type:complete
MKVIIILLSTIGLYANCEHYAERYNLTQEVKNKEYYLRKTEIHCGNNEYYRTIDELRLIQFNIELYRENNNTLKVK